MKKLLSILIFLFLSANLRSQSLYFPSTTDETWATVSLEELGWCPDKMAELENYLGTKNTKAFILLKDGKIVVEKYYGTFTADSLWYWASAGKTITAFMIGIAQQEQHLKITDTTSKYLGEGWTSAPPDKEEKITIRHQLTMTSGLDDGVPDHHCTSVSCLTYLADAGTRWAYHNGPYTLLDKVIFESTQQALNNYTNEKLKDPTGMTGFFVKSGDYNNVFFSKARSMARFGLLILNRGNWDGEQIMTDADYFDQMVTTSQTLNPSYGYLWWLNGKSSYKMPTLQLNFPGPISPNAPDDMIAALGKNGQLINVVPSKNLVFIRMGNVPDAGEVPVAFNDSIWKKLNAAMCTTTSSLFRNDKRSSIKVFPNPALHDITIEFPDQTFDVEVFDIAGRKISSEQNCAGRIILTTEAYPQGFYYLQIRTDDDQIYIRKILIAN